MSRYGRRPPQRGASAGGGLDGEAPPTASARSRRLLRPLSVMSPVMPWPVSMTSMHKSSSTLTVMLNSVAPEWRTALLTASRTTASAWSASAASTTDSGPMNCTVVRSSGAGELCDGLFETLPQPGRPDGRRAGRRSRCGSPGRPPAGRRRRPTSRCCTSADRRGRGALQRQPDREQSLDDVVVQIAGDPVAIGQDVEFAHLALACWPAARPAPA